MRTTCVIAELVALFGYLVAAVGYPLRLLRPDLDLTRWARAGWLFGAGLQAVGLVAHAATAGGDVVFGRYANVVFLLVLLVVVGTELLQRRTDRPAMAAFNAPIVFLLVLSSVFRPTVSLPPSESPWFWVHIVLTLLGIAGFGVAFGMACGYVLNDFLLKRKQIARLRLLPPLATADNVAHLAVAVSFPIYTLGLIVGAETIWVHRLPLDAKAFLAVACWLVFAAYLYLRGVTRHRGKRLQVLIILGFALALANFVALRHDPLRYDVTQPSPRAAP